MPGQSIHALTNLSAGSHFELPVDIGTDVVGAAKAYLADRDLPEDVQQGFYVSVFPTRDAVSTDATDRELPPGDDAGEGGPRHAAPAEWYAGDRADQSTATATASTATESAKSAGPEAVGSSATTSDSVTTSDFPTTGSQTPATPEPEGASETVATAASGDEDTSSSAGDAPTAGAGHPESVPATDAEPADTASDTAPEAAPDSAAEPTPEAAQRPYLDPDPARVQVPLRWETEPDPTFSGSAEDHDLITADQDAVQRAVERNHAAPGTVGLIPTPEQRRVDEEPSGD